MVATVRLAGSARLRPRLADSFTTRPLTQAELAAPAVVTVHLREASHTDTLAVALARQHHTPVQGRRYLDAAGLVRNHSARPDDVEAVTRWARGAGLRVHRGDAATTTLDIGGSLGAIARAFDVTMQSWRARGAGTGALRTYRDHNDEVSVPANFDGIVTAVLGLSSRPVARPRLSVLPRGQSPAYSYSPEELARLYDFPVLPDGGAGARITVGIAELGGAVYRPDLAAFAARHPRLRVVEEAVNSWGPTSDPFGPDTEVALDWQVIAGVLAQCAPQADVLIVIKYAPNTDRGFTNMEASFATDGRDYAAVSTSWGAPEDRWTPSAMDAMDRAFQMGALRGIVHTVAAGDNGSTDARNDGLQHADHPASAPHAVACGGTRLIARDGVRLSEEVWNELRVGQGATGGGVSEHFDVPRYQSGAGILPVSANDGRNGRGVPDVAADADPCTGYIIHHRGLDSVVGGTSAVAPLWTALFALISEATGHRLGNVLPALYGARAAGFTDVTGGDNGAYPAAPGWDAATGLGVPSGRGLSAALKSSLVLRRPMPAGAPAEQPAAHRVLAPEHAHGRELG
jgi:kumamolisin